MQENKYNIINATRINAIEQMQENKCNRINAI